MLLTLLMKMSLPMPSYCFCLQSIYEQEKKRKQKKTTYFNIIVIHEVIFLVVSGPGRAGPSKYWARAGPSLNFFHGKRAGPGRCGDNIL